MTALQQKRGWKHSDETPVMSSLHDMPCVLSLEQRHFATVTHSLPDTSYPFVWSLHLA